MLVYIVVVDCVECSVVVCILEICLPYVGNLLVFDSCITYYFERDIAIFYFLLCFVLWTSVGALWSYLG